MKNFETFEILKRQLQQCTFDTTFTPNFHTRKKSTQCKRERVSRECQVCKENPRALDRSYAREAKK